MCNLRCRVGMIVAVAVAAASTTRGATITWVGGVDNNWANASNWNPAEVPGTNAIDVAVIGGGGATPSVTSTVFPTNDFDIRLRNSARIDVGATLRDVRNFDIGTNDPGSSGTVAHTAGTVRITNRLQLGFTGSTADATYALSGGTLIVLGGGTVDVLDGGIFEIDGTSPTVSFNINEGANFTLSGSGTLSYKLGASGVSLLNTLAAMNIGADSLLTIDATSYSGGVGTIPLASFGSLSGSFDPANISITGLAPGLSGSVEYTSTNMNLVFAVPEPGTCSLAAGCVAVGLAVVRRRGRPLTGPGGSSR